MSKFLWHAEVCSRIGLWHLQFPLKWSPLNIILAETHTQEREKKCARTLIVGGESVWRVYGNWSYSPYSLSLKFLKNWKLKMNIPIHILLNILVAIDCYRQGFWNQIKSPRFNEIKYFINFKFFCSKFLFLFSIERPLRALKWSHNLYSTIIK